MVSSIRHARAKSAKRVFRQYVPGSHVPYLLYEDVDGRDKPGHDVCVDSSAPEAITNSGFPIRTVGTLRGS